MGPLKTKLYVAVGHALAFAVLNSNVVCASNLRWSGSPDSEAIRKFPYLGASEAFEYANSAGLTVVILKIKSELPEAFKQFGVVDPPEAAQLSSLIQKFYSSNSLEGVTQGAFFADDLDKSVYSDLIPARLKGKAFALIKPDAVNPTTLFHEFCHFEIFRHPGKNTPWTKRRMSRQLYFVRLYGEFEKTVKANNSELGNAKNTDKENLRKQMIKAIGLMLEKIPADILAVERGLGEEVDIYNLAYSMSKSTTPILFGESQYVDVLNIYKAMFEEVITIEKDLRIVDQELATEKLTSGELAKNFRKILPLIRDLHHKVSALGEQSWSPHLTFNEALRKR